MTIDVKICGLKTSEALDAAIDAGAAYGGLVFEPRSVRHLEGAQASTLVQHNAGRIKMVALFVNPDDKYLREICAAVKPDMLQLHGTEPPERVAEIKEMTGLPAIKAIGVASAEDARAAYAYEDVADLILFDTKLSEDPDKTLPGGSGQTFDWHHVSNVLSNPFMLAGGLRADNVSRAIAISGAAAVDVSSAVESAPGQKDVTLIREFIRSVQSAGQISETS